LYEKSNLSEIPNGCFNQLHSVLPSVYDDPILGQHIGLTGQPAELHAGGTDKRDGVVPNRFMLRVHDLASRIHVGDTPGDFDVLILAVPPGTLCPVTRFYFFDDLSESHAFVASFFAVFLAGFFSVAGSGALSSFAPQSMQKITQFTDFTRLCSHPI
jgi:hypothetical protein